MTPYSDRVVLVLEVVFGVLPISIIGGGYAILGLLFGSVSTFLAIREHAVGVFALWFGILTLAAGGLFGIVGLWSVVAISARLRPPTSSMIKVALAGSVSGVLTAAAGLVLMLSGTWDRRPLVAYILAAPVLVVLHRGPAVNRLRHRHTNASLGTPS